MERTGTISDTRSGHDIQKQVAGLRAQLWCGQILPFRSLFQPAAERAKASARFVGPSLAAERVEDACSPAIAQRQGCDDHVVIGAVLGTHSALQHIPVLGRQDVVDAEPGTLVGPEAVIVAW